MTSTSTIYYPSLALRSFISHYNIWRYNGMDDFVTTLKDYPRTAMDMTFFFEGSVRLTSENGLTHQLSDCSFVGHFDQSYEITPSKKLFILNVRFLPNGVYPLTKIPLHLTFNNRMAASDLMGNTITLLQEQLAEQPTDQARIDLLESYLLKQYQSGDLHYRLDHGIQKIQETKGMVSVKNLCDQLHTNYKSLNRWFEKGIGLSPKRFIQLTRFKYILDDIETQNHTDWMQLVEDYNFHDQAHFSKEFKQFAGVPPSSFRTASPTHLLDSLG